MKKALLFLVCIAMLMSFCSCKEKHSADRLLTELLAVSGEDSEGSGWIYLSGAEEGDMGYLSHTRINTMYGDGSADKYFHRIEEYAMFVSARIPGELAVFKCYSSSDTDRIAEMCMQRADGIKVSLKNSEYAQKAESIRISIHRNIVVFSFTEDPRRVENKFKELV